VLSSLPTGLTTGQSISARVDALHSKHMQLSITMQDAKEPHKGIRHQILTSTMDGFKVGQQFNASIQLSGNHAANKPNVFLNVITQQTTTPAATTLSPAHFKLSAGDTTAAIVQQRLPNGNIQLNIQGTSVETAAPANIKKGDLLMLKMTKAPADFQLLSVQKDAASKALATHKANFSAGNQAISQHLTSLRNTLPAGELSTKQTLASLDSAMKAFEVSPQQPLNGKRLAHMMQHSGNHLEAKLLSLLQNASLTPSIQQDLKAIMLQLSHAQSSKAASSQLIHRLAELGQQSLARIESGQALNVLAHIQQEPIRMELPMLVGQQMVNVQLSMQQNTAHEANQYNNDDDDNNTSNQSYNILFALDLSQLGSIRVDANISGNSVHARIYNDNADSKQFIQNHIQRLEERLQSLGFEEVYLISSQQAPNSEKQQRFDQLTQMMPAPSSFNLLDIRI